MALKEKQTQLKASNNATYKTVEGVTYFKLKSEFEGDYTKHCGLLGEEIDENFYFLRGYDIESVEFDDKKNLIIQRVDKDYPPIVINMEDSIEHPTFDFDKEKGTITVTYPDGTIKIMDGFFVEGRDVRIATDSTLNGNGTMFNPMRLAEVETTGTFAPADEYFDLTDGNTELKGKGKGYRVVTREKIDNFGCLYPFSAVKKIQDKLTETTSQWRVPSKKDWDELLNALECPEDRNHSANTCTWLGKFAGVGLKSANLWKEHSTLPTEDPTNGQDVRGLTVYPLGITPDRNEILNDNNYDAEGFGQIAGMWTSTVNDEGNAYVKMFGYNSAKVDQDTYGEGARMSIRLVKDYAYDNFNEIETILGFPYPTELVYGIHDDLPYVKIWTKINLYSDAETLGGIRSDEWSAVTDSDRGVKIIYFINEWDGTEWHKKPMENGDSVVIIDREGKPYHEWRIIEGELIDTAEALAEEFNRDFAELKEDIAELSATTKELVQFSGWVVETINEFSAATEEHINRIDATVAEFSAATVAEIARLDGKVDELSATTEMFSAATVAEIERLDADVAFVSGEVVTLSAVTVAFSAATVAEIERSTAADEYISGLTAEFSAATVAEFVLVNSAITVETERAMAAELYLSGAVETEIARAMEAESFLSGAVDTERDERIAEDDAIKAEIKSNKINSKDIVVNKTAEGTSLTIQTDNVTITKVASAATIYDTNVAVLGTLLKLKEVEPKDTTIRFAYELQDGKGNVVGDQIKIPFESSLVKVIKGHSGATIDEKTGHYTEGNGNNTIDFVYRLADGTYSLTQIAVSDYFNNLKFGDGLNVDVDGTVKLIEGDGNEFLTIGEDTIAVTGVSTAIAIAKAESETIINEKYESATGYTDQRYNESIAHTDTRVNDVVSSVSGLTNTLNTAVESMNTTLNTAVEGMNETVNSAVEGFNTLLTESINGVNNSLDAEITNRQNADNVLDEKISGNTTAISTLQSGHIAFSGSIISYVDNKVNGKFDEIGAAASAETKAKEYADNLNAAMSERVNALEGDSHTHTNKVELDKIAEGDKAKWDDAVSRLDDFLVGNGVDEVIDTLQDIKDWMKGEGVVATELTEAIAAEAKLRENADTALGTRITALEGINHNAYIAADDVLRNEILTLSGYTFNALTSERDFVNAVSGNIETTLIAKTDALNNALTKVSSNVDTISGSVNSINISIKELSGSVINVVTAHTADINRLSGDVVSYVDTVTSGISYNVNLLSGNTFAAVTKNEAAIAVLNADKKTEGSVLYRIDNEMEKSMIYHGAPITTITPEDAQKLHSLIYQITVNGEKKYYASSEAVDMYYIVPETKEAVNLNAYITELNNRILTLEEKLSGFAGDMEQTIKDLIKSYLVGTENEIKIAETDDKLKIGFDDNAIFGEI